MTDLHRRKKASKEHEISEGDMLACRGGSEPSVRSRKTKRLPKQGGKKKRLFNCQKVCALPCLRKVPLVRVWSCPKFAAQCRQKAQRMVIHGNVWVTGRCVRLVRRLIVQMKRDDQEKATNRVPCRRNDPAAGKFSTVSVFCLLQSPC